MSYLNEAQAGGIDPLRDHRPNTPLEMRHSRVAVRVVERGEQDGRYKVVDGAQDTYGDINCAAFWPKATRPISGWAFAWPVVVARGQIPSGGRTNPPTTPRVTVTPDPHSPTGAGVVYSTSRPSPGGGTTAQSSATGVGVSGGSAPRATRTVSSGPGAGTGAVQYSPGDAPAQASGSPTAGANAATERPWGANTPRLPNVVSHWQGRVRPNPPAVPAGGGCSLGNNDEGDPFNVGLGADGGQGGVWGIRFGDAANGGGGGVFGPNIGAGGQGGWAGRGTEGSMWGGVFGYQRVMSLQEQRDWAAAHPGRVMTPYGGQFTVGAQGAVLFGPVIQDYGDTRGGRRSGGNYNVGRVGDRGGVWGMNFGNWGP